KSSISSGVAHLVKSNALLKAKEVALRIKDGLVIGSDTVVCSGFPIF
ncbi:MAG: hypothetical protein HQL13_06505, partial [Candidatus Omnitrophica bacterium]|nr:hypothetical protein [Candidatus Omnitrophota bacterium]